MPLRSIEDAKKVNRTGRRLLDGLARDMRITDIWHEGVDGYWAQLVDGYNWCGVSVVHEPTIAKLLGAMSDVETGPLHQK